MGRGGHGLIFGVVIVLSVELLDKKIRIDDPVGAVSVHGVCGALGTLLTGVFASGVSTEKGLLYGGGFHLLGVQAVGVISVAAYVAVTITVVFQILKRTVGLRASKDEELSGLDLSEHGLPTAYAGFTMLPDTTGVTADVVAVTGDVPAADAVPVVRMPTFSDER